MRWYVEATKIGAHTPPATLVVDAEAWPRALQAARAIRGESGPITDFTIELLEDGCRAIEPHGLLAYRVTTAPDDTPLGEVRGPSLVPPRPAPSSPAPSAPAVPPAVASSPASVPSVPSVPSAPVSAPAAAEPPPPPSEPALPAPVVVFERSQLPTADSPLHYRELAFALPADTTEEVAERAIFAELARIQKDMASLPSGKLINLAAFDRVFSGRPSVLPIATLTWKDWRTDPVLDFPLRRGTPAAPMPLSFPPPPSAMALGESARISSLPSAAVPAEAAPPSVPAPPASVPAAPPSAPPSVPRPSPSTRGLTPDATIRIPLDPPVTERGDAPLSADRHLDSLDLPKADSASQPVVIELPEPSDPALPHDTLRPGPPPPSESSPAAAAAPSDPSSDGLADIPAVDARDSQREPRSFGSIASSRSSIPRMVFARKRGDELLSVLFEAMYDLAFLRDAVEGADFCVGLALEQIPATRGFVHLYDMDRREFVVVAGRGNAAAQRLLARTADQDARFHAVMRQAGATVDGEAVFAPIVHAGRYIGILELDGALDQQPFGEAEGHALVYIARQYAEFVAQRGVVIDAQRVSERPTSRRE